MQQEFDYIVIGSGFGGSVAALRLAEKGYSVLLTEQGKRFTPAGFPKSNWNLPQYLWFPALRFFGFQKLSFFSTTSILSGTGVGGGSLVYANTLYMPPDEFFTNQNWNSFGNWKDLLAPFYERAAFMLGRERYNKINREDKLLKEIAEEMGAESTFETVNIAVNLDKGQGDCDPYFGGEGPLRKPCIECGGCMVGCRENAKNTLDRNYLWFAEKLGVKIMPLTKAEKITYKDQKYHVETFSRERPFRKDRKIFVSKGIVLAAGALGTMEFLLKQKYKYKTMPGISEALGHELRTNSETLCAVSGIKEKMNNGVAISSVFSPDEHTHVEVVKYPDRSNVMKLFFGLATGNAPSPPLRSLKLFAVTVSHPWKFLKTLFNFSWSTGTIIFLVMQSMDNSMKMIWKNNIFGGRMKVDNHGQKRVPAYIEIGQNVMERYAEKSAGIAQNILLEVFFDRPTTAHILGGCPMSESSANGVVSKDFELHGYPGFYITDGSVVQGNIGVNPSFTITAQAEYCMNKIPGKAGGMVNDLVEKLKYEEEKWKGNR